MLSICESGQSWWGGIVKSPVDHIHNISPYMYSPLIFPQILTADNSSLNISTFVCPNNSLLSYWLCFAKLSNWKKDKSGKFCSPEGVYTFVSEFPFVHLFLAQICSLNTNIHGNIWKCLILEATTCVRLLYQHNNCKTATNSSCDKYPAKKSFLFCLHFLLGFLSVCWFVCLIVCLIFVCGSCVKGGLLWV